MWCNGSAHDQTNFWFHQGLILFLFLMLAVVRHTTLWQTGWQMLELWQVQILLLSSLEIKKILIMTEKLRFWKPADLHKKMVSFILFFFPCKSEFSGMWILGINVKNLIPPRCRPTSRPTRGSTHHQHSTDASADIINQCKCMQWSSWKVCDGNWKQTIITAMAGIRHLFDQTTITIADVFQDWYSFL